MISERDVLYRQVVPYLRRLGYEAVRFEQPFGVGSRRAIADAVAYDSRDAPAVLVEVKRGLPGLGSKLDLYHPIVQQAYRGALVAETPHFLLTDGERFLWFRVDLDAGVPVAIDRPPEVDEKPHAPAVFHSAEEAQRILWAIADMFRSETHASAGGLGQCLISLVQAKVCDELRVEAGQQRQFYVAPGEDPRQVVSRLNGPYRECTHEDLPLDDIATETLSAAVSLLEPFSFLHTGFRLVKPALDNLIIESLRRDSGEFLTPSRLIDFMVAMVAPSPGERVIDPVCGTGGSLSTVVSGWRARGVEKAAAATVYGVDRNAQMAQLARLNVAVSGGLPENVFRADSLDCAALDHLGLTSGTFDVVLANPPMGFVQVGQSAILREYQLAHQPGRSDIRKQQSLDALFLERCLQLLRPGGRLAMLVPERLLFSQAFGYVRSWLLQNAAVDAVISLPLGVLAFSAGMRTSLLLLTKGPSKISGRVFMAIAEYVGYDSGGRLRDENDLPSIAQEYHHYCETGATPASDKWWAVHSSREMAERLDPAFYQPKYRQMLGKLDALSIPVVRLGEITETIMQGVAMGRSAFSHEGVAVAGPSQIGKGSLDLVDARRVPRELAGTAWKHAMLREGDLLISVLGQTGQSALVTDRDRQVIAGSGLVVIRPRRDLIDPSVLHLLFNTSWIRSQIDMLVKGATLPRLTVSDLRRLLIPLPGRAVQDTIAGELQKARVAREQASAFEETALALLESTLVGAKSNAN